METRELVWDEQAGLLFPQAVSGYVDNETMKRVAILSVTMAAFG
jgi:hypothetical protein